MAELVQTWLDRKLITQAMAPPFDAQGIPLWRQVLLLPPHTKQSDATPQRCVLVQADGEEIPCFDCLILEPFGSKYSDLAAHQSRSLSVPVGGIQASY